jgi:hypothetical protein
MRYLLVMAAATAACASAGVDVSDTHAHDASPPDAFVADAQPPDAGPPDATPCQLVPQNGCAAQQACDLNPTYYAAGLTKCRAAGSGKETKVCSVDVDCAIGYTCLSADSISSSCAAFCGSDAQCTAPGGLCVLHVTYDDGVDPARPVPNEKVCSTNCDPLAATGCPTLWNCQVWPEPDPGTRFYTSCTLSGTGGQGDACTRPEDCKQNFACGPTGACLMRCLMGATGQCPGIMGVACTALSDHPTVGGKEYGVCHE